MTFESWLEEFHRSGGRGIDDDFRKVWNSALRGATVYIRSFLDKCEEPEAGPCEVLRAGEVLGMETACELISALESRG